MESETQSTPDFHRRRLLQQTLKPLTHGKSLLGLWQFPVNIRYLTEDEKHSAMLGKDQVLSYPAGTAIPPGSELVP